MAAKAAAAAASGIFTWSPQDVQDLYSSILANGNIFFKPYGFMRNAAPTQSPQGALSQVMQDPTLIVDYAPGIPDVGLPTDEAFGQMMASMTPRTMSSLGEAGSYNPRCFLGQADSFAYSFFPVVYHVKSAKEPDYRTGIYKMQPPTATNSNNVEMVAVAPFICIATSSMWSGKHPAGGARYTQISMGAQTLYIDRSLISDATNNTVMSIRGAAGPLLSRWGAPDCYLTIFPYVTEDNLKDHTNYVRDFRNDPSLTPVNCWAFSGASLGMSVAASIAGCPPLVYTGYLGSSGVNTIFTKNGPKYENSDVILGANMVENIDDLDWKVLWAMSLMAPLIIPHNVIWYNQDAVDLIARAKEAALRPRNGKPPALQQVPEQLRARYGDTSSVDWAAYMRTVFYSCQMRSAGMSFATHGSNIMTAVNFSDCQVMAATWAAHMYKRKFILQKREKDIKDVVNPAYELAKKRTIKKAASASRSKAKAVGSKKAKGPKRVTKQDLKTSKRSTRVNKAGGVKKLKADLSTVPTVSFAPFGPSGPNPAAFQQSGSAPPDPSMGSGLNPTASPFQSRNPSQPPAGQLVVAEPLEYDPEEDYFSEPDSSRRHRRDPESYGFQGKTAGIMNIPRKVRREYTQEILGDKYNQWREDAAKTYGQVERKRIWDQYRKRPGQQ